MGKKLYSFFTNNLIWKAMALLLAIIMWFIAMNLENPVKNRTIPVLLEIRNQEVLKENNLVLLDQDLIEQTLVNIRLTGTTRTVDGLNAENTSAYIDLAPANFSYSDKIGQTLSLQVYIELPRGAESTIIDYRPNISKVDIVLDYLETVEENVRVRLIQDAEDGYVTMDPILEPASIRISGAKSILESIAEVRVEVDLENMSDDLVTTAMPIIYDINNEDISHKVTVDTEEINVIVPINRQDRILINTPNIRGYVAEGYTVTEVNMSQNFIEVIGKIEDINRLSAIYLDSINVSGASRTVTQVFDVSDILENANLTVKEGSSPIVEVEVVIEEEATSVFTLPIERIEIIGDSSNAEFENQVSVTLRGQSRLLNALDESILTGAMDITGLEDGTHEVPVHVNLPEGMVLAGETVTMTVIINDGTIGLPEEESEPEEPDEAEDVEQATEES